EPEGDGRNVVVLSLPVRGTTQPATTDVAASLLRGLIDDYFDTYGIPIRAEAAHIMPTGSIPGSLSYSLSTSLNAASPGAFWTYANEIRTAVEQALEDLPKNLARPDRDTAHIIAALRHAERLEDTED
ncbi:MAG: hypothetical protein Q7T55_06325, partial [Solirubrobacteraceae bacterium]|nr:hypothetical protein [Solirubrobacteraceae bacterium]